MTDPIISIITPSLNRAQFIVEAIESVLSQDYPAIEHIIIDGGSTDGTLEILKHYPHLKIISEPDAGLYDAINKGVRLARGEFIGLLNTDDRYAAGAIPRLAEHFLGHPDAFLFCGKTSYFVCEDGREETFLYLPSITPQSLAERLTTGIPAINSCFFRKAVFDKLGYFDLRYRLAADRDLLLRFACAGLPLVSMDEEIYCYRSHPDSLTIQDVWNPMILDENLQLAVRYGQQEVPSAVRQASLKWENVYTLEVVGHFLRKRDFRVAFRYFRRTSRRHWWWPVYFMFAFPMKAAGYLRRKRSMTVFSRDQSETKD